MTWELLNEEVGVINAVPDKARLLGEVGVVEDSENSAANQQRLKNSGMPIFVRRVRFGGAYAVGSRVKWTSGYAGTRVEQAGASEKANGIVDPFLSAVTAAGDVGLIFIAGPMDVISSAAISANAKLKGAASGKVVTDSTVGDNLSEGVAIEAATGADENIRALMDFPQY